MAEIPESIRLEHEAIHSALVEATKAAGAVGVAARALSQFLHPHFEREEEIALPPLGLLAPLSRGVLPTGAADVLSVTDALTRELPRMLEEHKQIHAAVEQLRRAAREEQATRLAIGDGEPIRDIAAVWDVEVLSAFLGRNDLRDLIRRSLAHFDQRVVSRDGYAIVAPGGESSSIAHSAFLSLALTCSDLPDKVQRLTPLTGGILRQQRKEGSYKIFFDAVPDSGEELYPAEAMLALLEAYRLTDDARYLESVERGFVHYKRAYYDPGLLDPEAMVFFANGQSQVGHPLFEVTSKPGVKDLVRAFLFELHDRIIESGFYDRVARRPEGQACVEVACGLEGLADAHAIAVSTQDRRTADYRRCITTALAFLVRAQRTTGCTDRERGGFGGSLASREQRIDVTGHVASGFIKSVENGITEPTEAGSAPSA